jgi:uncharacterized membrane protein YkoI
MLVNTFAQEKLPVPDQNSATKLPLEDVVERALATYPGRLLEAEREQENGRQVYQLEIIDEDGRTLELDYDVFTGELMQAQEEHDTVYDMRRAGRILPLSDILARAQRARSGELLEADLDDEHGRYIYELEMAGDDGLHRELYFDAETGELLKIERDD